MTELKTLKDMQRQCLMILDLNEGTSEKATSIEELKKEAIKWIKREQELCLIINKSPENANYLIKWIKHFFNIKEEELK